jgi:hypothetical protein
MREGKSFGSRRNIEASSSVDRVCKSSLCNASEPDLGTFEQIRPKYRIRVNDSAPSFGYSGGANYGRIRKETENVGCKFWGE